MTDVRKLKTRIRTVRNTQQITKAMKMVSTAKLRRSQMAAQALRPYTRTMAGIISKLAESGISHPLLEEREKINKVLYVLIGSNRGLCGSFNNNLHRFTVQVLAKEDNPYDLMIEGRKAAGFFLNHGYRVLDRSMDISDNPGFEQARQLNDQLCRGFLTEEYDEIYVIISEFKTAMSSTPRLQRILPIRVEEPGKTLLQVTDYLLEPDPKGLLDALLPQYLDIIVYSLLQEAKSSEHGARMTAMSTASDNAAELTKSLTLSLNRVRQAAITTEITEIISGASALKA